MTRHQHILFRLGEWIALGESAAAMARYTADPSPKVSGFDLPAVQAMSRLYARDAALRIATEGLRWIGTPDTIQDLQASLNIFNIYCIQEGLLADMDAVAQALKSA